MNYVLHLNERQAEVIVKALDLASRIAMGQLEEVGLIYRLDNRKRREVVGGNDVEQEPINMDLLEDALAQAKAILGHDRNSSWGIRSEPIPEQYKIGYDIQQVIRHRLAWDRKPEGGIGVDFHEPFQCGKEPLATMEKAS